MSNQPIRVGIVGSGVVAQIIHLPWLSRQEDIQVVALCETDVRKATMVAKRFSVPNIYQDIEDMFNREDLDVAFILTPTNMHLPMALLALKHGCHVFIEKPVARNAREAQKIAEAARKADRHVMVGMQNRFRADVEPIKTFLDDNQLGDVFFVKTGWLQTGEKLDKSSWVFNKKIAGGGVLLDLGIQLLDLAWWMNGKPNLVSVSASSTNIKPDLEVEDYLSAYLTFDNGMTLFGEFSWAFPIGKDRFYLDFFGKKGSSWLSPLRIQRLWRGQVLNITPDVKIHPRSIFKKSYETELQHFFDFLRGDVETLISPIDEAVTVMEMIDKIYQALENQG